MTTEDLTPPQSPDDAIARVGNLAAAAAGLAAQPGSAVVPTGVGQAEAVKAGMVEKRAALLRQKQEVERAAQEAKAIVEAQVKAMERKLAEQMALLQPALEQLALLSDGVDALNIYLGRDEEIIPLVDGERAPDGTVVSVRQLVLAMDEESLLFADTSGMDFRDIDAFADWLSRDPAHLETLLPKQKGIVALIPRRARRHYEDPWLQQTADVENNRTFWLIRNGQAAWLTTAPFSVGRHTVPTPKEFTDLFIRKGSFGQPDVKLEPGTDAWVKAEKQADARTRHYMKVALLLQGILDRTTILHPHGGLSLLDQSSYDEGRARVILDGENALTDGRPQFAAWRREKVKALHPGMRVIGAFSKMRTYDSRDYGPADVRPKGSSPANYVPYNVRASNRAYYDWEFNFDRTDTIWDEDLRDWRAPKAKATGYLSNDSDWWLPLDTITEDEIRYYMEARTQRHAYLDMIPALREALAVKVAERDEEAQFRTALIDALTREAGLDGTGALADELIHWYKTANQHHRALDPEDARAAKVILTEARRRGRGESKDAERLASLLAQHTDAMVVARRSSDFVVAVPEERTFPTTSTSVFCRLYFYTLAGKVKETREWVTLTRSQTARWTVLHKSAQWDEWTFNPDLEHHYTDSEMNDALARLRGRHPDIFAVRVKSHAFPGALGAQGDAYAWSEEFGLRKVGFWLRRESDGARISYNHNGLSSVALDTRKPEWRSHRTSDERPDLHLWLDETVETRALAAWESQVSEVQRARAARDHALSIASKLERVWEAAAEEQVKERFVEDFGDASLWDGHRKTIKLPVYPFRWKGDEMFRERLTDLFTLDSEVDIAGLTIAEILDLADGMGAARRQEDTRSYSRVSYAPLDESLMDLVPVPRDVPA